MNLQLFDKFQLFPSLFIQVQSDLLRSGAFARGIAEFQLFPLTDSYYPCEIMLTLAQQILASTLGINLFRSKTSFCLSLKSKLGALSFDIWADRMMVTQADVCLAGTLVI